MKLSQLKYIIKEEVKKIKKAKQKRHLSEAEEDRGGQCWGINVGGNDINCRATCGPGGCGGTPITLTIGGEVHEGTCECQDSRYKGFAVPASDTRRINELNVDGECFAQLAGYREVACNDQCYPGKRCSGVVVLEIGENTYSGECACVQGVGMTAPADTQPIRR